MKKEYIYIGIALVVLLIIWQKWKTRKVSAINQQIDENQAQDELTKQEALQKYSDFVANDESFGTDYYKTGRAFSDIDHSAIAKALYNELTAMITKESVIIANLAKLKNKSDLSLVANKYFGTHGRDLRTDLGNEDFNDNEKISMSNIFTKLN